MAIAFATSKLRPTPTPPNKPKQAHFIMEKITITVADFIIKYGIEALKDLEATYFERECNVIILDIDLRFHSRANEKTFPNEREFDDFHKNGHYRFYVKFKDNNLCQWIYGSDALLLDKLPPPSQAN